MRGRKPEPNSVRDGRDPAVELARAREDEVTVMEGGAQKPAMVETVPELSSLWDQLVGDGSAYRPQDAPLLSSWVYWTELSRQLMDNMLGDDGQIVTTLLKTTGKSIELADTPQFHQLEKATNMSLKLAEHFGGTPMARARLGLTKAATAAALGDDLRNSIIQAMREANV